MDLTKAQLDLLKEMYLDSRLKSMTEYDLRKFVRDVLELQVRGTVGNEEEREVWKEMKEHFDDLFEQRIREVLNNNDLDEVHVSPDQEDFKKRLLALEQRKKEDNKANQDMW